MTSQAPESSGPQSDGGHLDPLDENLFWTNTGLSPNSCIFGQPSGGFENENVGFRSPPNTEPSQDGHPCRPSNSELQRLLRQLETLRLQASQMSDSFNALATVVGKMQETLTIHQGSNGNGLQSPQASNNTTVAQKPGEQNCHPDPYLNYEVTDPPGFNNSQWGYNSPSVAPPTTATRPGSANTTHKTVSTQLPPFDDFLSSFRHTGNLPESCWSSTNPFSIGRGNTTPGSPSVCTSCSSRILNPY